MATAAEVVSYIKAKQSVWGETQVQKLLYYSQAWSLVWTGSPIFPEKVEAWKNGPVVRSIRYMTDFLPAQTSGLTDDEKRVVDAVLAKYGSITGTELSSLAHDESPWQSLVSEPTPWKAVYSARSDQSSPRCSDEIGHDAMRRFYTLCADASDAPTAPSMTVVEADDDELFEIVGANAARWKGVLELLAK